MGIKAPSAQIAKKGFGKHMQATYAISALTIRPPKHN